MFPIKYLTDGRTHQFFEMIRTGHWDKIVEYGREAGRPPGEIEITHRIIQIQARWEDDGRRIYELTPELTAAFAETECPLKPNDIPWPHPIFYIASPRCGLTLSDGVQEAIAIEGWYVDVTESGLMQVAAVGTSPEPGGFVHFAVPRDIDVEEYLKTTIANAVEKTGPNAERMATWARVCVGTCAYLASERPSVDRELFGQRREHREDCGDKKRLKAEAVSINYFRLGASERLPEHFSADGETRRLTKKFVVRGHYRRLGSGRTTWVRPHWKGPEWGQVARAVVTKIKE